MIAYGTVVSARQAFIEAKLPAAAVGSGVRIACARGALYGTVTALCDGKIVVSPHGSVEGIVPGDEICTDESALEAPLGMCALGRAFDGNGNPIDGKRRPRNFRRPFEAVVPLPRDRCAVTEPFWTGVAAIDGLLTVGTGARIGIFGAAGAGKSSLLRALMGGSHADAVVIGLVGERGREAEEWIRKSTERTTIFCATGDRPAIERVRAARLAMAQASELRSRGMSVLLILDSLARLASAHREIAVGCGESVGRGGYPPRVFTEIAAFAEVAGASADGSITLFATILQDGDDRDPVSESARALLDGHVVLSSELVDSGKFPAVDILRSRSRTMDCVAGIQHLRDAATVRSAQSLLEQSKDAREIGVASSAEIERASRFENAIEAFARDPQRRSPSHTVQSLRKLAAFLENETCASLPN
jgi:FliI/YscN family ATPase